jgi:hypothetical protein
MIYHASIPTAEPERAAAVIAELWGGRALPFPPCPGAFMAMAGDARNSAIECYPAHTVVEPGASAEMCRFVQEQPAPQVSAFHLAVATPLSEAEVHAVAAREGWRSVRCSRGGQFDVIEFWLENSLMLEVLTAEMQAQYLEAVTIPNWMAMLEQGPPPQALAA